jgi:hypothetical protein
MLLGLIYLATARDTDSEVVHTSRILSILLFCFRGRKSDNGVRLTAYTGLAIGACGKERINRTQMTLIEQIGADLFRFYPR